MPKKIQIICNIPFPQGEKLPYPFFTLTAMASDLAEARDVVRQFQEQYGNVKAKIYDYNGFASPQLTSNSEIDSPKQGSKDVYASNKQIGCLYHALLEKGEDLAEWCAENGFSDQYHIPKRVAWNKIKELMANNDNYFQTTSKR